MKPQNTSVYPRRISNVGALIIKGQPTTSLTTSWSATMLERSQRVHLLDADGLSNFNCSTPKAGHVDKKIVNNVIRCFPISAVLNDTVWHCALPINAWDANLLFEIINYTTPHRALHPCPRPSDWVHIDSEKLLLLRKNSFACNSVCFHIPLSNPLRAMLAG